MGFSLLCLDRLRQRRETDQASTDWQWQPGSLRPRLQRVQKDRQTRATRNDRYCNKLGHMSAGIVRNWQDV